jgi:hypothetical protein
VHSYVSEKEREEEEKKKSVCVFHVRIPIT